MLLERRLFAAWDAFGDAEARRRQKIVPLRVLWSGGFYGFGLVPCARIVPNLDASWPQGLSRLILARERHHFVARLSGGPEFSGLSW